MPDWLNLPAVEAQLKSLGERPSDVAVLRDAISVIAKATGRVVPTEIRQNEKRERILRARIKGGPKLVMVQGVGFCFDPQTLDERKDETYNCEVGNGRYLARVEVGGARRDEQFNSMEKLAWRCCGFLFSPQEVRAAMERAREAGVEGPIPLRYFTPIPD